MCLIHLRWAKVIQISSKQHEVVNNLIDVKSTMSLIYVLLKWFYMMPAFIIVYKLHM